MILLFHILSKNQRFLMLSSAVVSDADLKRLPFARGCFIEPVAIKNIQQDIKLLGGMAGAW